MKYRCVTATQEGRGKEEEGRGKREEGRRKIDS
jgi:hypothetical protein